MPPPPSTQPSHGVKRKKPPTFQHLPAQRGAFRFEFQGPEFAASCTPLLSTAKKLKRSWVEVQKIKSKWKAQKRKEGLSTPRANLEPLVDDARQGQGSDDDESRDDASDDLGEAEDTGDESSEVEAPPPQKRGPSSKPKGQKDGPPGKAAEPPSLRELQRQAYSRSSLHTNKSHPLGRHKGTDREGGRGRGTSRGGYRGRGRGQPDMGLRMKAMLEKIKQDCA